MDKEQLRASAAISFMSAILENTTHNVLEAPAIADLYAEVAVNYADALIKALDKKKGEN